MLDIVHVWFILTIPLVIVVHLYDGLDVHVVIITQSLTATNLTLDVLIADIQAPETKVASLAHVLGLTFAILVAATHQYVVKELPIIYRSDHDSHISYILPALAHVVDHHATTDHVLSRYIILLCVAPFHVVNHHTQYTFVPLAIILNTLKPNHVPTTKEVSTVQLLLSLIILLLDAQLNEVNAQYRYIVLSLFTNTPQVLLGQLHIFVIKVVSTVPSVFIFITFPYVVHLYVMSPTELGNVTIIDQSLNTHNALTVVIPILDVIPDQKIEELLS